MDIATDTDITSLTRLINAQKKEGYHTLGVARSCTALAGLLMNCDIVTTFALLHQTKTALAAVRICYIVDAHGVDDKDIQGFLQDVSSENATGRKDRVVIITTGKEGDHNK